MTRAALGLALGGLIALLAACDTAPLALADYPCPPGGTDATYANFAASFLDAHCNSCHSAPEGHRHGAPITFRFDTLDDNHHHADRIFIRSALTNTSMPPGPTDPTPADRDRLADWLACGGRP